MKEALRPRINERNNMKPFLLSLLLVPVLLTGCVHVGVGVDVYNPSPVAHPDRHIARTDSSPARGGTSTETASYPRADTPRLVAQN
jgi:hypothetical protein